jgi:hypothetical protein
MTVTSQISGFKTVQRSLHYDQRARQIDFQMAVGQLNETVTVTAEAPLIDTRSSERVQTFTPGGSNRTRDEVVRRSQAQAEREQRAAAQQPSVNVQSLQRRAAGVLPVRIEVPRAGNSHRFVRPLVIDEETVMSFRYKRR